MKHVWILGIKTKLFLRSFWFENFSILNWYWSFFSIKWLFSYISDPVLSVYSDQRKGLFKLPTSIILLEWSHDFLWPTHQFCFLWFRSYVDIEDVKTTFGLVMQWDTWSILTWKITLEKLEFSHISPVLFLADEAQLGIFQWHCSIGSLQSCTNTSWHITQALQIVSTATTWDRGLFYKNQKAHRSFCRTHNWKLLSKIFEIICIVLVLPFRWVDNQAHLVNS